MQLQPNGKGRIHCDADQAFIEHVNVFYISVLFAGGLHELFETAHTEDSALLLGQQQRRFQKPKQFYSRVL